MNNLSRISRAMVIVGVLFCTAVILTEYPFVAEDSQVFFVATRLTAVLLPLFFLKRIEKDPHDFFFIGLMTLSYSIYNSIGYMYRPFYVISFTQTTLALSFLYFPKRNHYIYFSIFNYLSFTLTAIFTHKNLPYKKGDETLVDIILTTFASSLLSFIVYHYFTANRNFKDRIFERFSSLGRVTTMIVHDLKGSLSAPLMLISALEESLETKDIVKSKENLALLKKQLISLTNVVSKLNQLSDITEAQNINEAFNVSESIENVRMILAKRLSNIQLIVTGDCILHGSKELFTSIMLNIVTNALDEFMINKTENGKITILASSFLITVKDNGPGFKDQTIKKLASGEMFSNKEMGSGLGLYLVREGLKSFSGKMEIDSSEEGGIIKMIFKTKKVNEV